MISVYIKKPLGIIFLIGLPVLLGGCAGGKSVIEDQLFEKWAVEAQKSAGYSPAPRARITILSEAGKEEKQLETAPVAVAPEPERKLPAQEITLKMRQADVKAVIRALARIAGQNILVKNDIKGEINVDFSKVPWDQAFRSILHAQALSYIWDGEILRVVTVEDMEQSLKIAEIQEKRRMQTMEEKRVEPMVTMMVQVDYADADTMRESLIDFLTRDKEGKEHRGSVQVDKHNNALIVRAIRDDIDKMIPIIEKIDKPTPQINIKANIVETTKEVARNLGIQWGGVYGRKIGDQSLFVTPGGTGGSAALATGPLSGAYDPTSVNSGISGQGFGVNFPATGIGVGASASLGVLFGTIGGNILEVQLNALQRDSMINILSSPSITTLDNQTAYTENGERVPFVSTATTGGGGATQEVKFEDAVLRLEITPHVIDGHSLKMKILVKKDEVDLSRQVEGNPFIIKKQTETTLIVQDGETIVISGLSKQQKSNIETGVPWLKEIPIFGWLFKGEDKNDQMEEVLIFITPRILPPQVAAARDEKR